MAVCKDPALTYLNGLGYNVVRLPRAGVGPLDVLGRDGKSLERLGTIEQIWTSAKPAPAVQDSPAAEINGMRTASLDLSVGLKLLGNALAGMGVPLPQLDVAYTSAKSMTFTFANVRVARVDPFVLGEYLSAGTLSEKNAFVRRYFDDPHCLALIITEVLKSDAIQVVGQSASGQKVSVDVPAIQQLVGATVSVSAADSAKTQVVYQGKELLTFGYKVFLIAREGGEWTVQGVTPRGELALAAPPAEGIPPVTDRPVLLDDREALGLW